MKLTRDTFKALKALLLDLPGWPTNAAMRETFIADALYSHPVFTGGQITFTPNGDTQATKLIEACAGSAKTMSDGKTTALCALLMEVRERGWASRESLGALEKALDCGVSKPNWLDDPYPGLLALDHWQAPIFFGRRAETRDLLRRLTRQQGRRLLLVTGASGSGKSSLVRAGVWAMLKAGGLPDLPGTADWVVTAMFPAELRRDDGSADPFLALTNSLKQHPRLGRLYPGEEAERLKADPTAFGDLLRGIMGALPASAEWLLVLDQMEELFTPACAATREPFLDMISGALDLPRFRVIATVRADFLGQCMNHPGLLAEMNNDAQYGLRAPGPLDMARMIEGPVRELDLAHPVTLDPDLVQRMVDDAVSEPGGLALLAFALKDLYDHCKDSGRMDLAAYESPAFGGLKGVIQSRADRALARAGDDARDALPRVFARLLTVQPDGTATRRREYRRFWAGNLAAERLIDEFLRKDTRLLVSGQDATIEVAHEALFMEWPTLVRWIDDSREALRLRERIPEEARSWVQQGRDPAQRWKHERLDAPRQLLSKAGFLEDMERDADIADFLTPEADWLLAELLCSGNDHPTPDAIGRRLCEIGDPRRGVGVRKSLPDLLWRAVPRGKVEVVGCGSFNVAPFQISAFPITCVQYRAFLDAVDGYANARWWQGLEREAEPGRQLQPYDSYPADNVSWYDATAFCRWLNHRLEGTEVRLPDELEWQWAAQSAHRGFVYPWGDDWLVGLANTAETGIGHSTAVGMYPGGRSHQGVYDLAGNLWEWCQAFDTGAVAPKVGSGEPRVLRGGAWLNLKGAARASTRYLALPDYRGSGNGFRVARASARS